MRARTKRAKTVALLVPLLGLFGCGHSARPAPPSVTMSYCGDGAQSQPAVVEVICATNDITARNLTWWSWGKPVTVARGMGVVDLCSFEDCHTGSYTAVPIVLVASQITGCGRGRRGYSRLQYLSVGASPFQGLPAHMNFANSISGTDRPGPAANQTVRLSC